MKFILKIIILPNLIYSLAYANLTEEQCTPVDIRDKNSQLKEFFSTPRDQDSIGWCYAFAAADLLSVEAGTPVSAAHTSAIYNKKIETRLWDSWFHNVIFNDIYESGVVEEALNYAKNAKDICTEAGMPFDAHPMFYYYILQLEEIKKYVEETQSMNKFCNYIKDIFPYLPFSNVDFLKLYHAIINDQLNKGLEELITNSCQDKKIQIPDFKVKKITKDFWFPDNENAKTKYFNKIGKVLASGKPLAITYKVSGVTKYPGNHASVVMAREWINNQCQYKVRNSWGRSCAPYKPGIQCVQEEGSFWVNEDTFYEMVIDIDYIPSK
jgi:hypothetical protein